MSGLSVSRDSHVRDNRLKGYGSRIPTTRLRMDRMFLSLASSRYLNGDKRAVWWQRAVYYNKGGVINVDDE